MWNYIRPEFDGFIRAGRFFFVWSSSAQISIVGRLNLDWGTRPPVSTLQFKYWLPFITYATMRLVRAWHF